MLSKNVFHRWATNLFRDYSFAEMKNTISDLLQECALGFEIIVMIDR